MFKRSALALRVIAALQLFHVARLLAYRALSESAYAEAFRDGATHRDAILAKLKLYAQIAFWAHMGTLLLVASAAVVLALSLRKGRAWAFAAAGLVLADVALIAISRNITFTGEVPDLLRVLWWAGSVSLGTGLALPLLAVAREAPSPLARYGVIGAACLLVIQLGIATFNSLYPYTLTVVTWLTQGSALLSAAWFASVALPLAGRLARAQPAEAATVAQRGIDGTPLRVIGWALLARIASAVTLQALLTIAMTNNNHAAAGALTTMSAGVGIVISIIIVAALVRYLGLPPSHRSDALIVAIGFVLLGIGVEIYAAYAGNRLFGLIAEAKSAGSFWGVPSLSEMETLQTGLTWAAGGAVLLGVGAGMALLAALKSTARALRADEHVKRANRADILLITAGTGVVAMGVVMNAIKRDAVPVLLLVGVALLVLAIMLLVDWLKLLFGLANQLECAGSTHS
jgi:hypothetical protein